MAEYSLIKLGAETLKVLWKQDADLGAAKLEFGVVGNALTREPAQTLEYIADTRAASLYVLIEGEASREESAADNKVRRIHNLAVEVAKATNTLTILGARRSTTTTYRVLKNQPFPQPFNWLFDRGNTALIPLTLNLRPWTEGAESMVALASNLETPNTIDVTIAGERPAELELLATRGFSTSGLQTLIVGAVPATFDLEDMLFLANDANAPNWSAYTATSGYVNASNNTLRCTETFYRAMYWGALPVGRYALFAKTRVQTGGKGWLAQARAGNDQSAASICVTDTDWRFVRLGDYASDGHTGLRIVGKVREAAHGILVDWVLAVPLDLGSPFYFHCTAHAVNAVRAGWIETELQVTGGGWRSARRYVQGAGISAVGAVRLVVAACDANGALRRPETELAATYTPLHSNWVPKPEA